MQFHRNRMNIWNVQCLNINMDIIIMDIMDIIWCHIDTTPKAGLFIQLFAFLQSFSDLNFSRSVLTNL